MNALSSLIQGLSKQEQTEARAFIEQRNRRGDTKNQILFELLCKGDTDQLQHKLYNTPNTNAYHALRKRLLDLLVDFLATKSFQTEASEEMTVLKLLLAGRLLFEKEQNKQAWKVILKAEKLAKEFDLYAVLQEIYQTQLQYAHIKEKSFLKQILLRSSQNLENLHNELNLQQAYAYLKSELKTNPKNPNTLLNQTLQKFNIRPSVNFTYKSLYQFMELLTDAAELSSDYYSISPAMQEAYRLVVQKETSAKHMYYHIQVLYLIASVALRTKAFKKTIAILDDLDQRIPQKHRKRFNLKLDTLRALAFNYSGNFEEAIRLARRSADHSENLKLLLLTFYFQQNQIRPAYDLFKSFQKSDTYYENKNGLLWVVKKELIGLLLLVELDKVDLIGPKLISIKKRFSKRITSAQQENMHQFLKLINRYYDHPQAATSAAFKDQVEVSFNWLGYEREDLFAMSFYAWLKSKMQNKPLYAITLELVNPTSYSL